MAGSKKKGSKVPLEEIARLAEEARRAGAAEKRRQEAEASKENAIAEKASAKKAVEQKRTQAILEHQRALDKDALVARVKELDAIDTALAKVEDWQKWVACVPLPDVDDLASLNTFLKEKELYETDELMDDPAAECQPMLDRCYTNEQVITLLTTTMGKALEDRDLKKIEWCQKYRDELRDSTQKELDKLTISYLHLADSYHDDNSPQEVVAVAAACPRDIEVDPDPPFDWLPGLEEKEGNDDDDEEEENKKEEKPPMKIISYPKPLENEDVPEMYFGVWVHTSNRERVKAVHFKEIDLKIPKLPLALQQTRTCIRVFKTSYDHFSGRLRPPQAEAADGKKKKRKKKFQRFVSVGGIVNIEQLAVPPQPKHAKGWVVREHSSLTESLSVQAYPTKVEGSSSSEPTPPLEISYKIPEFVLLKDGYPHFGWWNDRSSSPQWEEEGIEGNGYDPETRIAKLKLSTLRPFAVIQPRALDFPYRAWSLGPTGPNTALVTVTGSRFKVELELVGGQCQLIQPQHDTLAPIFRKLMDPGKLLLRLQRAGINLCPTDEDAEFCRKPNKSKVEWILHKQLSSVACVMEVRGSNWSSSRGPEQCMFKIKISDTPVTELPPATDDSVFVETYVPEDAEVKEEPEPEEDEAAVEDSDSDWGEVDEDQEPVFPEWLQVAVTPDQSWITQSSDKTFNNAVVEGQVAHTSLRRTLAAYFNQKSVLDRTGLDLQAAFPQIDRTSLELQQNIERTLNLLRTFTFQ